MEREQTKYYSDETGQFGNTAIDARTFTDEQEQYSTSGCQNPLAETAEFQYFHQVT